MTATYIALEGPDGVGKSTIAAALKELLQKRTPGPTPYSTVRIRHFPTDVLAERKATDNEGCCLRAEDYALDMENWLSLRPEPVLFPDTPTYSTATSTKHPETLYILDRWALSTAVYASLRNERISENVALTLDWLNSVPLVTFVLLPCDPSKLTDPDYGADNGTGDDYDPVAVTEAYLRVVECALGSRTLVPVTVDRARDTPGSVVAGIVERLTIMGVV